MDFDPTATYVFLAFCITASVINPDIKDFLERVLLFLERSSREIILAVLLIALLKHFTQT